MIKKCTLGDIGILLKPANEDDDSEETLQTAKKMTDAVNVYLQAFAAPLIVEHPNRISGTRECLKCGERLDGLMGTFKWGLVHGEGSCSGCGWPCRVYHSPKMDGEEIFTSVVSVMLQYHPSVVPVTTEAEEN